jgi:hypothetical protein
MTPLKLDDVSECHYGTGFPGDQTLLLYPKMAITHLLQTLMFCFFQLYNGLIGKPAHSVFAPGRFTSGRASDGR